MPETPQRPVVGYTVSTAWTDTETVIVDNGDGTHSLRDTVENRWIERDGQEDMLPHQARSLKVEYDLS